MVPIPGLAHSSPIVWGDLVFVATAIPSGEPTFSFESSGSAVTEDSGSITWRLYALERDSGEVAWQRDTVEDAPETTRHAKSSPCNATPATDGRRVAAILGSHLHCYGVEGELLWTRDLGVLDGGYVGKPEYQWGHASSPVLFDELVIVQVDKLTDSYVAAYRAESGEEVWRVARDELPTWCTPTLFVGAARAELITNGGRHAVGYDPRTGAELWRFEDRAEVKVPTPIVADGLLYLAGGAPRGRRIVALRVGGSGELSSEAGEAAGEHVAWQLPGGGPYTVTPIVFAGRFYTLSDSGLLSCHEAATGVLVYRERLGTEFSASPVAAGRRLYLASEEGDVLVLAAGPRFELLARNEMGAPVMATPALSGDLILVRTTKALFALGA